MSSANNLRANPFGELLGLAFANDEPPFFDSNQMAPKKIIVADQELVTDNKKRRWLVLSIHEIPCELWSALRGTDLI